MVSKKQSEEEKLQLKKIDGEDPEDGYEYVVIPPDGGFGWVIALAAMVRFSICRSFFTDIDEHLF